MSILKVNSIEPANVGSEDYFLSKVWINFNGTGTPAIRQSGNVSSITDEAVGKHQINFTNALVDANYATSGGAAKSDISDDGNININLNGYNGGSSAANTTTKTNTRVNLNTSLTFIDSGTTTVVVTR